MANKARNYGLPTQNSINEVLFGSPNYVQTDHLDRRAVNTAIARVIMPYPKKIATYDNIDAAREVAAELKRAGFPDVHIFWSIIFDKNVKFKVVRPSSNKNVFCAVGEKQKYK